MGWNHEHSWKLEATPGQVFAAFTDPARLTKWFAERADIAPRPGGNYRFWGRHTLGTPTERDARQTITRIEPGRSLSFTWAIYGVETEASIALASEAEGSRLTLHHEIKGDLAMPRPKELIEDHWKLAFGNLAAHLAGGSGILLPDYADPAPEIRMVIRIEAKPEAVFRALVEPELINKWFGTQSAIVDPRAGDRYALNWKYQVDGKATQGDTDRRDR